MLTSARGQGIVVITLTNSHFRPIQSDSLQMIVLDLPNNPPYFISTAQSGCNNAAGTYDDGSINSPYPMWNGWQGSGYYYFPCWDNQEAYLETPQIAQNFAIEITGTTSQIICQQTGVCGGSATTSATSQTTTALAEISSFSNGYTILGYCGSENLIYINKSLETLKQEFTSNSAPICSVLNAIAEKVWNDYGGAGGDDPNGYLHLNWTPYVAYIDAEYIVHIMPVYDGAQEQYAYPSAYEIQQGSSGGFSYIPGGTFIDWSPYGYSVPNVIFTFCGSLGLVEPSNASWWQTIIEGILTGPIGFACDWYS